MEPVALKVPVCPSAVRGWKKRAREKKRKQWSPFFRRILDRLLVIALFLLSFRA
jgi:hypothetical protein